VSDETVIAKSRERFVRETATHEMEILRDDGPYRHVRFMRPGTSMYYFDLVTWPGWLVVCGDVGDYMFSRTRDMFEFFGPSGARGGFEDARWGINPYYWGEKLRSASHGRDQVRSYSPDVFRAAVLEWFTDAVDGLALDETFLLRLAVDEEVLLREEVDWGEDAARGLLYDFEWRSGREWRTTVASEMDFREWDWSYLWCCWAIVWGIGQYDAARVESVTA